MRGWDGLKRHEVRTKCRENRSVASKAKMDQTQNNALIILLSSLRKEDRKYI